MVESVPLSLKTIPVVRRVEYLEAFLDGVSKGFERSELEAAIGERKKAFELEKNLALGRGKPYQKKITEAVRLQENCLRLSKDLRFVEKNGSKPRLLEKGRLYLETDEGERIKILGEAYSEAYPHLAAIILALCNLSKGEAVLPLMNNPPFRPEIVKYGVNIDQVSFDTVRDIGTRLGLMNWYVYSSGSDRRQYVYSTCGINDKPQDQFLLRLNHRGSWLYAVPNGVEREEFRAVLWDAYITLVNGVPGSPVFYSLVREQVCATLKIRDDQFDAEVMSMVEWDEHLHVIWSEGVLPYQHDSASMLKSLPPKNEWGRYVVYLKIVRR